jgi:MoaA/NifB/PqqE/SkfB family radical SAM enzyme
VTARPAWKLLPETTDDAIDYAHATTVGFRGGEPFLSDNTWHVLEQLAQANNTACVINFTTNGSIALTAEQRNLLARFDTVGFNFSIDGVGAVFEYVRYPLQWTDLEQQHQILPRSRALDHGFLHHQQSQHLVSCPDPAVV